MRPISENQEKIFEARYEKSASALIAVAQTLEKEQLLSGGEQEFLDLYQLALDADPEVFTEVWLDPSSYFWIRIAYELLGSCISDSPLPTRANEYCQTLGYDDPKQALTYHLHSFKSFILGIQFLEGKNKTFETSFIVNLPYSIPGTLLSLDGEGQIEVIGIKSRALDVIFESSPVNIKLKPGSSCALGKITICEGHVIKQSGCETILKPQTFNNLPSLEFVDPVVKAGLSYHQNHSGLIQESLEIIEQYHPETFHLLKINKIWAGLKPLNSGGYTNVTCSELPLSFMVSVINNPFVMADTFIHEFSHNCLFFIEENGPFLNTPEFEKEENYYSPWRSDLRPLQGILHALFVYIPVAEFWGNVSEEGEASELQLAYAKGQWLGVYLRLIIGLFQLNRFGSFTTLGQNFISGLAESVKEIGERVKLSSLTFEIPEMIHLENGDILPKTDATEAKNKLNVAESVVDHMSNIAPDDQKSEILKEQVFIDLQPYYQSN